MGEAHQLKEAAPAGAPQQYNAFRQGWRWRWRLAPGPA